MTTFDRFDRDLPVLLEELYLGPMPAYRDDIVSRTAATSQRPSWSFPERWLPMSAITERMAAAPRVPWRMVGVIALLILALAAAALYVGSQQRRLPAPFGPAGNGLIAYISDGQVWTAAPDGSDARLLTSDATVKGLPLWSRDGTRLAFLAYADPSSDGSLRSLIVVNEDGSRGVTIAADVEAMRHVAWSPDGKTIAYSYWIQNPTPAGQRDRVFLAAADGSSPPRQIGDSTLSAWYPAFSPDGSRIAFLSDHSQPNVSDDRQAIHVMAADGSDVRELTSPTVEPFALVEKWAKVLDWSPDGTQVIFTGQEVRDRATPNPGLYVVAADGSTPPRRIADGSGTEYGATWSPTGEQILYVHESGAGVREVVVMDADGSSPRVIASNVSPFSPQWSPDGKSIAIVAPYATVGSVQLVSLDGGAPDVVLPTKVVSTASDTTPGVDTTAWQRVAVDQ